VLTDPDRDRWLTAAESGMLTDTRRDRQLIVA
jgi:hypothetical protein